MGKPERERDRKREEEEEEEEEERMCMLSGAEGELPVGDRICERTPPLGKGGQVISWGLMEFYSMGIQCIGQVIIPC